MPNPFAIVRTRADYFRYLDEGLTTARRLASSRPRDWVFELVEAQLNAMKRWTSNARKPSFQERRSISIGRLAVRELDDAPDLELEKFKFLLTELSLYFKYWRTDAGLDSLDISRFETDFPSEYDLSDE